MRRYGYNSRLFRDSLNEKRHYKLYKKGKMWLVAGISVFSSGLAFSSLNGVSVKADTVDTTATATAPDATADSSATQSSSDKSASDVTSPVATQTKTDTDSATATSDSGSTDAAKTASSTDQTSAVTDKSASNTDAAATDGTTAKAATQKAADQTTATTSATDATKTTDATTDAASTKSAKITEYSKEAGQNLIKQAAQAQTQVQSAFDQSNALADANPEDNIPRDDALAALVAHQGAQKASVDDAVSNADAIAVTDKQTALDNLNKALTVVDNMTDEVAQAGVLLESDKKGIQASVVTNAQKAYESVSLSSGVNTKLDAYGDLIVTASNDQAFQSVVANLADNGLITSFRAVVDPAESAALAFTPSKADDGSDQMVVNSDGSGTFTINRVRTYNGTTPITFKYSGNAGDKFFVTLPASLNKQGTDGGWAGVTGNPTVTNNADGSHTLTWTVQTNGQTATQNIQFNVATSNYSSANLKPNVVDAVTGSAGPSGEIADQTILPISYGGTNLTTKTTSITLQNTAKIETIKLWTPNASIAKTANTDYTYQVQLGSKDFMMPNSLQTNFSNVKIVISTPANFTLDSAATEQSYGHYSNTIANAITVTQAGGKGTPITIATKDGADWEGNRSAAFFVGSYSAGTTGQQTFKVTSAQYSKNYGNPTAPIAKANGAENTLSPRTSAFNGLYTFDGTAAPLTETVNATGVLSGFATFVNANKSNQLLIGSKTSNVIGNVSYNNNGSKAMKPEITVSLPKGVDSTGIYIPLLSHIFNTVVPDGLAFDVTVNYSNGTNKQFKNVAQGQTLSTIPQTGTVNTTTPLTVPAGATISGYTIDFSNTIDPGQHDQTQTGLGGESLNGSYVENDLQTGQFGILGYVDPSVADQAKLTVNVALKDLNSGTILNKDNATTFTAVKSAPITTAIGDFTPIKAPNGHFVFTVGLGNKAYTNPNLNADGLYVNNTDHVGNYPGGGVNTPSEKDQNDQPGFNGVAVSKFEPVMYITVPKQTQIVKNSTTGDIFTKAGAGWDGVTAKPKVTPYTNADGQTVYKIDYTGTGFDWQPNSAQFQFDFNVDQDATTLAQGFNSTQDTTVQLDGHDVLVKAATTGGVGGESTAAFMLAGNDLSAPVITSTANFDQSKAHNLFTTLKDASGNTTKVTGLSTFNDANVNGNAFNYLNQMFTLYGRAFTNTFIVQAPASVVLTGSIMGNQDMDYTGTGSNSPVPNGTDSESIRLRLANNTSNAVANVAGILNLPQEVTANAGTTAGKFALKLSGAVKEGTSANGSTSTLYSTQTMKLSTDGKSIVLGNGHVYNFSGTGNTTTGNDLMTAAGVSDWSTIKSLVTMLPKLAAAEHSDVIIPVTDPTSAGDSGKSTTIQTAYRADGLANVQGTMVDNFATRATIKNVDQNGHEINGYPAQVGAFDASGAPAVDATGKPTGPTGATGAQVANDTVTPIPGYTYVTSGGTIGGKTVNGSDGKPLTKNFTFAADGSLVITNHYQVNEATLTTVNKPGGTQINETAKGDPTPNTTTGNGSANATGVSNITFTSTDANLAVPGYTYTVSVNGGTPSATLAAALATNATYDTKLDDKGATQKFVVTYKVADNAITVGSLSKVYDNDATKDPFNYAVSLPTGLTQPTWTLADFTAPTSQNVSATPYAITLSTQGLADLKAANAGFDFTSSMVKDGSLKITPASITITAPTQTKPYDMQPFAASALAATVLGQPAKGVAPVYTLNDVDGTKVSEIKNVGTYVTSVTAKAADNPNYTIKTVDGKLTITPVGELTATIGAHTKVYDGTTTDKQGPDGTTTDATKAGIYSVTLSQTGLTPINWEASDFTVQNVQPDVGTYQVVLTKAGQDKIAAVAGSYTFNATTDIKAGSFKITPATITITAPTTGKPYDGTPFDSAALKTKVTVDGVSGSMKAPTFSLNDVSQDVAVGTYDSVVTATAADNPDYTIKTVNGKLTINPIGTLTATIGDHSKVYDGTSTDTQNGGVYDVTFTGGTGLAPITWTADDFTIQNVQPDVGTYQVGLSEAGQEKLTNAAKGYTFDATKNVTAGSFKITPAAITITGPTDHKPYDGNPFDPAALKSGTKIEGVTGSMKAPTFSLNDVSQDVAVGSYDTIVTAKATDNPDYTITTANGKLTIDSLGTLTATIGAHSKVYDGTTTDTDNGGIYDVTLSASGLTPITWAATDFTIQNVQPDVGTYQVGLSEAGQQKLTNAAKGYTFDATKNVTAGSFKITPATITITAPTTDKIYDGNPFDPAALKSKAAVDGVSGSMKTPTFSLNDVSHDVAVGSYDSIVTATAADNPDYTIKTVNGKLTINPIGALTATIGDHTKVYDGTTTDTQNGGIYDVTLSASGLTPITWAATDFTIQNVQPDVGTYQVGLSEAGQEKLTNAAKGYTFDATKNVTAGSFKITPATITITGPTTDKTYDGNPFDSADLKSRTTIDGVSGSMQTPAFSLNDVSHDVAVGTYDSVVTATAADNPDYTIKTVNGKLTINPIGTLTATIGDHSKVYDGTSTDTQNGGIYDVTLSVPAGAGVIAWAPTDFTVQNVQPDVGTYQVVLSGSGQSKLANAVKTGYTFDVSKDVKAGSLKITPATITITGPTDSKVYDGQPFTTAELKSKTTIDGVTGSMKAPTYTLNNVSGDVAVGSYDTIVTASATDNPDYTIQTVNGTLTITPLGLEVTTPNEPSKPTNPDEPYNNPALEASIVVQGGHKVYDNDKNTTSKIYTVLGPTGDKYAGFVVPTFDAGDFDISQINENAGTYKVKLTSAGIDKLVAANKNFTIKPEDIQNGLYVIDPAPVMVKGQSGTKTYDGTAFTNAQLISQGEVIGKPAKGVAVNFKPADISNIKDVGTVTTIPSLDGVGNRNYLVTPIDGQLTINPLGLEQTPPNDPGKPTNPDEPNNNPALEASVVVQGARKVYDNDPSNTPKAFKVLAPTGDKYASFVVPAFDASDFAIGSPSQNAGQYKVTLTQTGIDKLVAANKNFTIKPEDIQSGLYVIDKAPVMVKGQTGTKTYDGTAFTTDQLNSGSQVIGKPAKGVKVNYVDADLSGFKDVGQYTPIPSLKGELNSNYLVTAISGVLTINQAKLTTPPENTPENPTNPKTPNDNKPLATSVVVQGKTKVYDGDPATDPDTFEVAGPTAYTNFTVPTLTANDFDTTGITAQDVGNYVIKLSDAGLAKIQAANPNYKFDATDVQNGLFNITKAPLTVNGPTLTKVYDGKSYTGADLKASVANVPAAGTTPVVSLGDISADVNVSTTPYVVPVTVDESNPANKNYSFTLKNGTLTITPKGLDVTPPNDPKTPSNPKTPNDNQPLATSVVVKGDVKTYDGDQTTDPTTFEVVGPTAYTDFVVPDGLTATDFDTSGINAQDVGNYVVKLSNSGIQKIQAANPNYTINANDIQNGLFVINPAPITITAPSGSKVYDGKPYAGDLTTQPVGVPAKGVAPEFSLTDVSGDTNVGTYDINVVTDNTKNKNYTITTVPGKLVITPEDKVAVVLVNKTKTYDANSSTDPTTYEVTLPTGVTAPTWTADDFDLSGITSQNVGSYDVTLSAQGISDLQAKNLNYTITKDDVKGGQFIITKAPVTITAPTLTKTYDGQAYAGSDNVVQTTGVPAGGTSLNFTTSDISSDVNVGSYDINITADPMANSNYDVTVKNGKLTITPQGLEQTPPNDPKTPTNPNDPKNNPQLETSVVVQGATKVYDGDATTDPTTYTVLAPSKYKDFVIPTLTSTDFSQAGITSQNVGNYSVTLTSSGLAKIQAANKNYTIKPEDIQNGLLVITKAPITIAAQQYTKTYDGKPVAIDPTADAKVTGQPTKGVDPVFTTTDLTGDINVGTYEIDVKATADANGNYDIATKAGQLTITPQSLEQTPPNEPGNPTNPKQPDQNPQLYASVVVQGATKVYDGDANTDPDTFTVLAPSKYTDFVIPTLTAGDFDVSGLNSQDVGQYKVSLNAQGIQKVQDANKNYLFDAKDVQNGLFAITPAPLTITGPTVQKTYDGQPYAANQLAGTIDGQPAKGVDPVYSFADISGDVNAGNYSIGIVVATASANKNYTITTVPGKLTISPQQLEQTVPNEPTSPVNPDKPGENPQQEASLTIQGNTKVYDGDKTTDPAATSYKVLGPSDYPDFVIPTLTSQDYDLSGITSQNVGNYKVTLSDKGLAKIQNANKNYVFDASDIQNGLLAITPASVTITAPTLSKNYDGLPYSGSDTAATVSGKPAKGDDLNYTMTDISGDVELGNYPITITANAKDNPNYNVTVAPGQLSINDTAHAVVANYVDQDGAVVAAAQTLNDLKFGDTYKTSAVVVDGYFLTGDPTNASGKVGHDDITVNYVYNKNGQYQITPPTGGETDIIYPNDPNDPGKVTTPKTGIVPNVPGYTPTDPKGNPLVPVDPENPNKGYLPPTVPNDPGTNTPIKYNAIDYTATAHYVDKAGTKIADDVVTPALHIGDTYDTNAKVITGYFLTGQTGDAVDGTMPAGNVSVTYTYDKIGSYQITPPDGGNETDIIYPNDPNDPGKVTTPNTGIVPNKPGYTPTDPNGNPLVPVDPDNPGKGYLPPTVPNDPSTDTPITYTANAYTVTAHYVDKGNASVAVDTVQHDLHIGDKYSTAAKTVNGYYLIGETGDNADGTMKANDVSVTYVYNKIGSYLITPPDGGNNTNIIYPNDPNDPGKVTTPKTGIVPNVPGYTPTDPNGDPLVPVDPENPNKGYLPPTVPNDPGTDTPIKYNAIDYVVTAHYVDNDGGKLADDVVTPNVHIGDDYTTAAKVIDGYYLKNTTGDVADGKVPAHNVSVTYTYDKNGSYQITPPTGGETDIIYPNDPNDPGKVTTPKTGIVPNVPGYTPTDPNGDPLVPVDPENPNKGYLPPTAPENPGDNTPITYNVNAYNVTVHYVDKGGQTVAADTVTPNKHIGDSYSTSAKVIEGYYLTGETGDAANGTMAAGNISVTYTYDKNGQYQITPPTGDETGITYPNDPNDPGKVTTPKTGIVPNVPGYTPIDPNGDPLVPVDPENPNKGYLPPTVPDKPGDDTPITYKAIDYTVIAHYVDKDGNKVAEDTTLANKHIGDSYKTAAKVVDGYYLTATPADANGMVQSSNVEVTYTYNKVGNYVITPPTGTTNTNVPYPNDPNDPGKVTTPNTGIVPNVPGYVPVDPNGNPLKPLDPNDVTKGYLPPTVPADPGTDTPIKYVPNTPSYPGGGTTTNTPGGNTPNGNTPNGNTPNGNTPNGNTPNGNTPNGNTPNSNTPTTPNRNTTTPNNPSTNPSGPETDTTGYFGNGNNGGNGGNGNYGYGNNDNGSSTSYGKVAGTTGEATKGASNAQENNDATGNKSATTLPQTNENQSADGILGILGMLGTLGLAGALKKRRHDDDASSDKD